MKEIAKLALAHNSHVAECELCRATMKRLDELERWGREHSPSSVTRNDTADTTYRATGPTSVEEVPAPKRAAPSSVTTPEETEPSAWCDPFTCCVHGIPTEKAGERGLRAMDAAHAAFSTASDVEITEVATNAIREARGELRDDE